MLFIDVIITKHTWNLHININISFFTLVTSLVSAAPYPIIIKLDIKIEKIDEHTKSLFSYFCEALLNNIHKIPSIIIHLKLFPSK